MHYHEGHATGGSEEHVRFAKKRKLGIILITGFVSLTLFFILSLTFGVYKISFTDALNSILSIILNFGPVGMEEKIVYHLRIPRTIAVILVGMGLATAGAIMQALIRNPLVDPFIVGVSSGASFGVVLVTLGGFTAGILGTISVPLGAVAGAIVAFTLTMTVAESSGGRAMSYVLGGTIIATGLSAATTLIVSYRGDEYHSIMYWLFGSFSYITWDNAWTLMIVVIPIILALMRFARNLNVLLLGDERAQCLGLNVRRTKRILMVMIAILAAVCVAFCGAIGFVGLIVPHVARMIIGGDHRLLLPASMIIGANLLLIADIFCKSAVSPGELPIGAIISVFGVPFFLYLMVREGKRYDM